MPEHKRMLNTITQKVNRNTFIIEIKKHQSVTKCDGRGAKAGGSDGTEDAGRLSGFQLYSRCRWYSMDPGGVRSPLVGSGLPGRQCSLSYILSTRTSVKTG